MNEIQRFRSTIFLIGARACGKSTIGKLLANRLQLNFLDMDSVIEEQQGATIQQLVAKEGWASFRTKEAALLQKLLHQDNLVVATGGGAILHQDIWPAVMEKSFVVWLNADIDTVRTRLLEDHKTAEQRPSLTGESLLVETEKIMKEREPLYRKGSHLQINSDQPLAKIIATIEKEFKE